MHERQNKLKKSVQFIKKNTSEHSFFLSKKMFINFVIYCSPGHHLNKILREFYVKEQYDYDDIAFILNKALDSYFSAIIKRLIIKDGNGIDFIIESIKKAFNTLNASYEEDDSFVFNNLYSDFLRSKKGIKIKSAFKNEDRIIIKDKFDSFADDEIYMLASAIYTKKIWLDKLIFTLFGFKQKSINENYLESMKQQIKSFIFENKLNRHVSPAMRMAITANDQVIMFMYIYNNFFANP